jgi:uncharacterized membrane-anchored protein
VEGDVFSRTPRIISLYVLGAISAAASVHTFLADADPVKGIIQAALAAVVMVEATRQLREPARARDDGEH